VAPIIKASVRDTSVLEALACAWLPHEGGFQITAVWRCGRSVALLRSHGATNALRLRGGACGSNEHMPRAGLNVKDKLYKAMRLLRCVRRSKAPSPRLPAAPAHALLLLLRRSYGRLRDLESFVVYPGEPGGLPVESVWYAQQRAARTLVATAPAARLHA
jgi:hypothetical protein